MEFIKGKPAIRLKDYIIVSDLHVGFEKELREKGYVVPNQTRELVNRLNELRDDGSKLIILGDVKHSLMVEKSMQLLRFLSQLSRTFEDVIIIKGNHDGGIEYSVKGFKNIKVVSEFNVGNVLMIHGHKYASEVGLRNAENVLMGHIHSSYKKKDGLGLVDVRKTWSVYDFNNEGYERSEGFNPGVDKVVAFPCFNNFFNGSGEKHGPYSRYLELDEVFTLNLVKLV